MLERQLSPLGAGLRQNVPQRRDKVSREHRKILNFQ